MSIIFFRKKIQYFFYFYLKLTFLGYITLMTKKTQKTLSQTTAHVHEAKQGAAPSSRAISVEAKSFLNENKKGEQ